MNYDPHTDLAQDLLTILTEHFVMKGDDISHKDGNYFWSVELKPTKRTFHWHSGTHELIIDVSSNVNEEFCLPNVLDDWDVRLIWDGETITTQLASDFELLSGYVSALILWNLSPFGEVDKKKIRKSLTDYVMKLYSEHYHG